ncbi:hypothetical protein HAZT_HAZT009703 [Hyalella azteca]|uniref:Ig-like domain-containing protein n=1 Tax=Hyalella azteca TaxID=294128 RepID=A0A6A0GSZ1_HYAAZ|nr:hypothetical protein HAZT_HAZT009703 [Hyalella azteca]
MLSASSNCSLWLPQVPGLLSVSCNGSLVFLQDPGLLSASSNGSLVLPQVPGLLSVSGNGSLVLPQVPGLLSVSGNGSLVLPQVPGLPSVSGNGCLLLPQVPGLLSVSGNGSLVWPPFAGRRYTAAVHAATYACLVTATGGRLRSRPVAVTAGDYNIMFYSVVDVTYEARVRDQHVMAGNVAVLTCELPSYVKDYVTVTSWMRDDAFNIFPSLRGGEYSTIFTSP